MLVKPLDIRHTLHLFRLAYDFSFSISYFTLCRHTRFSDMISKNPLVSYISTYWKCPTSEYDGNDGKGYLCSRHHIQKPHCFLCIDVLEKFIWVNDEKDESYALEEHYMYEILKAMPYITMCKLIAVSKYFLEIYAYSLPLNPTYTKNGYKLI